ncbi:redox-regulated ATPase YchF [Candidatus Gracilibacteria bacterium CG17_big_fil_post_rev_8_21_14_2_50_48_13]|nr:MAG: redox-regulated ATPase YchF [Candidatus Gracilibacteria bacterium CG17_big_fil_post_rev_8_21_14_2_50_48_13]
MSLQIGIVGLPNVGKSTLFNAMTASRGAQAANYPFCTIEPNVGIVEVQDPRLAKLKDAVNGEKVVPATVEFVDIAGLVKGAAAGEGLGNKFLSHIRNCEAVLQVVRIFDDSNVIHVENSIQPKRDIEIINAELILADLETVQKGIHGVEKKARSGDKEAAASLAALKHIETVLLEGKLAISAEMSLDDRLALEPFHLLTNKPFIYAANVSEDQLSTLSLDSIREQLGIDSSFEILPVSAKLEEELLDLESEEKKAFLSELGVQDSGLDRLISTAFRTLGLMYYFTAGEKEVRAWTIHEGWTAPEAAGVIHTDFERGFIKADVVSWADLVEHQGWSKAREAGKVRMEGKDYIVKDGDVMLFKFNV